MGAPGQDAMRAERFLEAGCAYAMDVGDAERFREPYLESMMPGLVRPRSPLWPCDLQ